MTYNILDDEENWKRNYAKHLESLDNESLTKELNFLFDLAINIDNTDFEEVNEVKTRVRIVGSIIKTKLDLADNKLQGMHIISEQQYKDLLTYAEHYNVAE